MLANFKQNLMFLSEISSTTKDIKKLPDTTILKFRVSPKLFLG